MSQMRAAFELPTGGPYLLAHSVGCLPVATRQALDRGFLQPWSTMGGAGWDLWLDQIAAFRAALAGLLGGASAHWCPQPSISSAISRLLTGRRFDKGRTTILLSREAFPSVGFAASGLERLGLRAEFVDGDPSLPESWARVQDADVAAVIMMHVHSNSGRLSPVAAVAAIARANGVFSIVDIAQSAGILPIAVDAWGVDAVVGTSVKWLCGGPGACFLWVSPALLPQLAPFDRGWFSHEEPFEMDIADFRYAPDARRFWGGTPTIAPYVIATAGIEQVARLGVDRIRAHNLALANGLKRRLSGTMAKACDLTDRGGTICMPLDAEQERRLADAGCLVDRRGPRIRLSFGPWNDENDLTLVADTLCAQ